MAARVKHTPSDNHHAEFVHVKAHEDRLWDGLADLLAKGDRNADHNITARNSTQRSSHQRPQYTPHTVNNDIRATDSDAFVFHVLDLNDDDSTNIDRARPHIMDGFPVISWRHFVQARS